MGKLRECCLASGWQHAASWVFCLLAGKSLDSELPPLENLVYQSIAVSPGKVTKWTNLSWWEITKTWCLKCLVSSWTPQSPHSLWVSSWIYWDLSFSTELSELDSSKASGGPVAHQTLLLLFLLYSSGTAIPGKVVFFSWPFQSLSEVSVAFLISGFPIPFWHVGSGSIAA